MAKQTDFYYLDQLSKHKNLQLELFISQEKVAGYHEGRVDASIANFPLNTEFYLCGNPVMVTGQTKLLKEK